MWVSYSKSYNKRYNKRQMKVWLINNSEKDIKIKIK